MQVNKFWINKALGQQFLSDQCRSESLRQFVKNPDRSEFLIEQM